VITLTTPQEGGLVNYATFIGQLDEPGTLTIDGNPMSVKADNSFNAILSALPQGQNTVQLIATDLAGNSTLLDRSFMLDSVPPASPDTTLIGVGTPAGGTVTVSAQAGSATEGDTVTLTNSRTGESVQTTVAVDGSYSAAIGAQDGDVIVILITDPAGNTAASRILQVAGTPPVLGLTVTAPLNGSTIADDRVGVGGTFQGAANIGITVNGVTAQTIGNTFCAGDIALNTGPNTLDITAKLPDGTTTTQTLSVNSSGTSLITLEADAERGFEPHTVTFGITDNTQATLTSIEYDFDSDGTIDATLADPAATVQHVYTAPGCYTAMVTATDALSGSYSSSQTISVTDVQGADGQLASIFYNMLSRIRAGDISGAMTAVDPDRVDHFTTFFNNFGPDLPVFVDNIGRLEGGAFGEDIARFVLIRDVHGKPVSFFLYFTKGDDGVWRIEEM